MVRSRMRLVPVLVAVLGLGACLGDPVEQPLAPGTAGQARDSLPPYCPSREHVQEALPPSLLLRAPDGTAAEGHWVGPPPSSHELSEMFINRDVVSCRFPLAGEPNPVTGSNYVSLLLHHDTTSHGATYYRTARLRYAEAVPEWGAGSWLHGDESVCFAGVEHSNGYSWSEVTVAVPPTADACEVARQVVPLVVS